MTLQSRLEAFTARLTTELKAIKASINSLTANSVTAAQVDAKIAAVIGAAPAALDTLQEIATALQSEQSLSTTLVNGLAAKANSADLTSLSATIGNPEIDLVALFNAGLQ
jgi:hypothetical protein